MMPVSLLAWLPIPTHHPASCLQALTVLTNLRKICNHADRGGVAACACWGGGEEVATAGILRGEVEKATRDALRARMPDYGAVERSGKLLVVRALLVERSGAQRREEEENERWDEGRALRRFAKCCGCGRRRATAPCSSRRRAKCWTSSSRWCVAGLRGGVRW